MIQVMRKKGRPVMEEEEVKSCRRIIALTKRMDFGLIERAKKEKINGNDLNVSDIIRLSITHYLRLGDNDDNA